MRLVKEIPHERYRITVHIYNAKYLVKIELGQFEQIFKISETDVYSLDEIDKMLTPELLSNTLVRFVQMREDWEKAFQLKNVQ
ncbi:MAG: hypothetical protein RLZ10_2245 [Bacteroidota bacterium]|jgi:hypothetical protein